MDFAPYQSDIPEGARAKSPPPRFQSPPIRPSFESSGFRSPRTGPQIPRASSNVQPLPPPSVFTDDAHESAPFAGSSTDRAYNLQAFETTLPMRLDYEAMLAYLLLPPAGGVFLLLVEHKSDYVRFHAWQSSMLFTAIFVLHLLLSWSKIFSWTLFAIDLCLIGFLAQHAYRDVENLEHYEVPFIGRFANSFVEDE